MSSYLVKLDENRQRLSVTLALTNLEKISQLIDNLRTFELEKYIDLRQLSIAELTKVLEVTTNKDDFIFMLDHNQISNELLLKNNDIQDIEYKEDTYLLSYQASNVDIYEKFKLLRHNVVLKSQSYELEIVASLLSEQDKRNEEISRLERENQILSQASVNHNEDELEKRYIELMEKYKQSLKRLEQLRDSKLGKLQVAYWNKKRGY